MSDRAFVVEFLQRRHDVLSTRGVDDGATMLTMGCLKWSTALLSHKMLQRNECDDDVLGVAIFDY